MERYESIRYDVAGAVATIAFARPAALNAWTHAMGLEITDALARANRDHDVRVIAFTGDGAAFSAGADLSELRPSGPDSDLDLGSGLERIYNPMILSVCESPKPVVAIVNGVAAGFSCSLAIACDLIVAAESASFLMAFTRVGLSPDGGLSLTLAARVGYGRAIELMMLGDRLTARDALSWGLVNRVYRDDDLASGASELCGRLASGPTGSYAAIKRLRNRSLLPQLRAQLDAEAFEQRGRGRSEEYREGIEAFLAKRAPDFRTTDAAAAQRRIPPRAPEYPLRPCEG